VLVNWRLGIPKTTTVWQVLCKCEEDELNICLEISNFIPLVFKAGNLIVIWSCSQFLACISTCLRGLGLRNHAVRAV
jgi:hypothetical protein